MADRAVGVPFAKEGIPFIAAPAGVTLLAGWLGWPIVALGAALLTLFVAWFFRNPARVVPQGPHLVVAPGDGKVIAIEEEFEPRFLKERSIRLTIFLNVFDVHINRMPCDGVVEDVQYQPGLFLCKGRRNHCRRIAMKSTGFKSSFGKDGKRRKAAMHLIPNLFTTGNLFCGVYAILSVFNANYMAAAIAILVALIFDVLDGKSARLTNSTSQFGLEYDSLSDVVSFGVAPGLLIYSWALSGQGTFGVAVMFAYVAMGAVRLARFNSTVALSDGKYFTGLAIPAAAGVIASTVVFDHHIVRMGAEVKPIFVLIITLTLSFLMVSTIKYRSFKELKFKGHRQITYLVWGILTLMMVAAWPQVMLFVIFAGYALMGPVERMFWLVARAVGKKSAGKAEVPSLEPKS
ncbi:MAG: CDP-diacylglycerol--serine O-phosphatidyltransferase [Nitrospirae bacterium]|nr:CDP-diacylglycerol--serine O-phosphatidyltransferase [Nitrospirota bacterium]